MAEDTYFDNVVFLSHFDSDLTDIKGHTATTAGGAAVSATQSKFGGSSLGLDGTGDWLSYADSSDWDLPADFTIEAFLYPTTFAADSAQRGVLSFREPAAGVATKFAILMGTDGKVKIFGAADILVATTALTVNAWNYIALVRSGTTLAWYINSGSTAGTVTNSSSFVADKFILGSQSTASGTGNFPGWIDEVRITKGIARTITGVPTEAFPNSGISPLISTSALKVAMAKDQLIIPYQHLYL